MWEHGFRENGSISVLNKYILEITEDGDEFSFRDQWVTEE